MRFGTWNVRIMHTSGSLGTVAAEISKFKLHLMDVQEVRWGIVGTEPGGQHILFSGKWNQNREDTEVDINRAWETTRESIEISGQRESSLLRIEET
jgi:hypothetical protein